MCVCQLNVRIWLFKIFVKTKYTYMRQKAQLESDVFPLSQSDALLSDTEATQEVITSLSDR